MRRNMILHVGMHRTATTLLQRALSGHREHLRSMGIVYVDQHQIIASKYRNGWMNRRGAIPGLAGAFDEELQSLVHSESERSAPIGPVLISSEALLGGRVTGWTDQTLFRPYAESALLQVIRALSPDDTTIVLYTRRQDTLMESCYLWELQKGSTRSFADQFPYEARPVLDYVSLIDRISALPSVSAVKVRPYELINAGPQAYVEDFVATTNLGDLAVTPPSHGLFENRSYSQPAREVAERVNPLVGRRGQIALRDFLWASFPAGSYPKATILDTAARQALLDIYATPNRELFREHMTDFGVDSYASDEATSALTDNRS